MKKKRFSHVLSELRKKRNSVLAQLRRSNGQVNYLPWKLELDDAIKCLEFCEIHNLNPTARVIELPDVEAGYFEYRIMIDNETDERQYWTELSDEQGNAITAIVGDMLILNSEATKK